MSKPPRERITLHLVDVGDDRVPFANRLRAALKQLLRQHRLKCVAYSEPPAEAIPAPAPTETAP